MKNKSIINFSSSILNSIKRKKNTVLVPFSSLSWLVCSVLLKEGYIRGFFFKDEKKKICILLKYKKAKSVISQLSLYAIPSRYYTISTRFRLKKQLGLFLFSSNKSKIASSNSFVTHLGGKALCSIF